MDNKIWPDRLYALDVSRGFAALSVVLWHWQHFAFVGNDVSPDFVRNSQPLYETLKLFYEEGRGGVQYFFLLSGFIFFWLYRESIQNNIISAFTFFLQRFSRLYPLHLATLLVVAMLQMLYFSREGTSFVYYSNDAYHFFLNLGFVSNWGFERGWSFNAPVWSVSVEVLVYIVFFLVAFFGKGGWLFSLSVSIASFFLAQYFGVHRIFGAQGLALHRIFIGLSMFFLGGLVFHLTFLISTRNQFFKVPVYLVTIIAWLFIIINFYFSDLSGFFLNFGVSGDEIRNYILFPFTLCSLALIGIDKEALLKPISWVGNITYSTYLLHFPLNLVFKIAVSYGIMSSAFLMKPLCLFLYFMTLIPMSYIVYLKFERPMQKIIRNQIMRPKKA